MFDKIQYEPDWLNLQKIGLIKARSFASTAKDNLIVTNSVAAMLDSNATRRVRREARHSRHVS